MTKSSQSAVNDQVHYFGAPGIAGASGALPIGKLQRKFSRSSDARSLLNTFYACCGPSENTVPQTRSMELQSDNWTLFILLLKRQLSH